MKSKKVIPLSILFVIFLMLMFSWNNVLNYHANMYAGYDKHIAAAEKYMEKEIYIDAVNEYKQALKIKPDDYDLAMKIVEIYQILDDKQAYLSACKSAIDADKAQIEPYIILADYYLEVNNYAESYRILTLADKSIDNEEIDNRISQIKGHYSLTATKYDTILPFYYEKGKKTGYAVVALDGKYGIMSTTGKATIKCEYDDIGLYSADVIPVYQNDEWYYITAKGYRKLVPDTPMDFVGAFCDGYAVACKDNVYGYINKSMKEFHFEYQYAGSFSNGVAAIQKDDKWAIINTSFKTVIDFELDDIIMDEYGFCSTYGVIWGKHDGKYYLYNLEGECISDGFDDAKAFASDEPAAVKMGDKWGFVSKNGKMVIEPAYEDANSFSLGYAPYLDNGKWGCIGENGNILIEPTFDSMGSFAQNGYSLVEMDGVKKFAVVNIYD